MWSPLRWRLVAVGVLAPVIFWAPVLHAQSTLSAQAGGTPSALLGSVPCPDNYATSTTATLSGGSGNTGSGNAPQSLPAPPSPPPHSNPSTSASSAPRSPADIVSQLNTPCAVVGANKASSSSAPAAGADSCASFLMNLSYGSRGAEVMRVQRFLNQWPDTQLASAGVGSSGQETSYFGPLMKAAVTKFQEKYSSEILAPNGLTAGNGFWGPSTRAEANSLNQARCSS